MQILSSSAVVSIRHEWAKWTSERYFQHQPRSQGFSPPRRRKALGTRLFQHDVYFIDTEEISTSNTTFFYLFSKRQKSAIKVVTYRKMPVTKMLGPRIQSYKGEIRGIILIFFVPRSQNSNEEEKNSITVKVYLKKSRFVNDIWKEPVAHLSVKLSFNSLITLVTMATTISTKR